MSLIEEASLFIAKSRLPELVVKGIGRIKESYTHQEKLFPPPNPSLRNISKEPMLKLIKEYLSSKRELGLYIHLPFCKYSCKFCNYVRIVNPSSLFVNSYLSALKKEFNAYSNIYERDKINFNAIYFGGGTPTYLSARQIKGLLSHTFNRGQTRPDIEITFEASPETINKSKIYELLEGGVNRLSIGVEALQNHLLMSMGRKHDVSCVIRAYRLAQKMGFKYINIDLIYGYPGQTCEDWQQSLDEVIKLNPRGIHAYRLLPGHGAMLYKVFQRKTDLNTIATSLIMGALAKEKLHKAGYTQQSLYKFTKPDIQLKRQKSFMSQVTDKIGLGVSARSYINGLAYMNCCSINGYLRSIKRGALPANKARILPLRERIAFIIAMCAELMRLDKAEFYRNTGIPIENVLGASLEALSRLDLINISGHFIDLTQKGTLFAQEVWPGLIYKYIKNYSN